MLTEVFMYIDETLEQMRLEFANSGIVLKSRRKLRIRQTCAQALEVLICGLLDQVFQNEREHFLFIF